MKEKADFSYLGRWLSVYAITSIAVLFCIGVFQIIFKFIFESYTAVNMGVWLVSTVSVGAILAFATYSLGLDKNGGRVPNSLAMPVISQIIAAAVCLIAFLITKGNIYVYGSAWALEIALNNDGIAALEVPLGKSFGYFTLQLLIYSAISLGAYILAKRKKDRDPVVVKLRAEYKAQNRSDDIFDNTRFKI